MEQKYTFTYSRVQGIEIEVDIYLPDSGNVSAGEEATTERGPAGLLKIPSVVFFHGGGLTAGNREFLPEQFKGMLMPYLRFNQIS